MASNLFQLGVGVVGVEPVLFFLNTDLDLADITTAGYIQAVAAQAGLSVGTQFFVLGTYSNGSGGSANSIFVPSFSGSVITLVPIGGGAITGAASLGGDAIYAGVSGSTLNFKGLAAGSNVSLGVAADTITINSTGGGGGFAYLQTLYVAQNNGSDSNTGTNANNPLLLVQTAITTAGTTPTIIYVEDYASNSEALTTSGAGQNIVIFAYGTNFVGSLGLAATDTMRIYANQVYNPTAGAGAILYIYSPFTYGVVNNGGTIFSDVTTVSGYTSTGGTNYINAPEAVGAFAVAGGNTYLKTLNNVNIALTASANLFLDTPYPYLSNAITNDGTGTVVGWAGGVIYGGAAGLAMTDTLGTTVQYTLVNAPPTGAGQALLSTGAGPGANTAWANPSYTAFAYDNSAWVAILNGSNLALGTSIETPLLTVQKALDVTGNGSAIIYVEDFATDNEAIATIQNGNITVLFAPGVTFSNALYNRSPDNNCVFNAYSFNNIYPYANNCSFNGYTATNITNGGDGNACNFYSIGTYTQQGDGYITANVLSNLTHTGGETFLTVQDALTGTVSTGAAYISILNNASLTLSSHADLFLMSPSPVTLTNDGTCSVQGFAGSTIYGPASQDQTGFITATVDAVGDFSLLASAGKVNFIVAAPSSASPFAQYKVTNMYLNFGGTNFAGGDRDLAVTDGTTVYSLITSATLLSLPNNEGWGTMALPYPASAAINTLTVAGANLYLQYSGGTSDYDVGSVTITLEYARVV